MNRTQDWSRIVLDAGPFFNFGSASLLALLGYVGPKAAISREVEKELTLNAHGDFPFLRAVELVRPPVEVIDLEPPVAEELLDRARAAQKPGDHQNKHKGEISTVLLAAQLAGTAIVICEDFLGKRLANRKGIPRLSSAQLAAEMVVCGAMAEANGIAVFQASTEGVDPRLFADTLRKAREAQSV